MYKPSRWTLAHTLDPGFSCKPCPSFNMCMGSASFIPGKRVTTNPFPQFKSSVPVNMGRRARFNVGISKLPSTAF